MSIFDTIGAAIAAQSQAGQQQAAADPNAAAAGILAGGNLAAQLANVDVEATLEEISRRKGNPNLNWRTSIVDLMKLLDLDSSLHNRAELATELGYTGEKNGSAEMNIWLHRRVMEELERNGGTVPDSLKH